MHYGLLRLYLVSKKYIAPLVNVLNTLLIVLPLLYIMNANKMRIAVFQFEIGSKNRL